MSAANTEAVGQVLGASSPSNADTNNKTVVKHGAKHMTQRVEARKATMKLESLGPKYPPIYPVYPRSAPVNVKPSALRVHPKGFRMLSSGSPLERNMHTYFRLPPQPPRRAIAERDALKRLIDKDMAVPGESST